MVATRWSLAKSLANSSRGGRWQRSRQLHQECQVEGQWYVDVGELDSMMRWSKAPLAPARCAGTTVLRGRPVVRPGRVAGALEQVAEELIETGAAGPGARYGGMLPATDPGDNSPYEERWR